MGIGNLYQEILIYIVKYHSFSSCSLFSCCLNNRSLNYNTRCHFHFQMKDVVLSRDGMYSGKVSLQRGIGQDGHDHWLAVFWAKMQQVVTRAEKKLN